MGPFNNSRAQCREFHMRLEDAATAAPAAKELPELFSALPAGLKDHALACLEPIRPTRRTRRTRQPK